MPKIWISRNDFVEFEAKRENQLSNHFATREKTLDFMGTIGMYLPDPDPVLRKSGKDIKAYRELMCDGHLSSVIDSRKSGVLTLEWKIEKENSSARHFKFINQYFDSIKSKIDRIIREILDAPMFGFSPIEIIWPDRAGANGILPAAVLGKPPEWFRFSNDNELLFITRDNFNGVPVPPRKFICATFDASYDNPYGKRVLSRCFWPVTFKRGGMKFWAMFLEKYGMPWVIGRHPRSYTEEQTNELLTMLENLQQNAVGTMPEDASVEIKESFGRSQSSNVYDKFVSMLNIEMSKAVLGQTLTTQMEDSGSFAASQTHLQVRQEIVDGDKKIVQNVFNELIGLIGEINFGANVPMPGFTLYQEEDVDQAIAERDKTLTETGVKFTKSYYTKTYGLDEDDFEIAETQPPPGPPEEFQQGGDKTGYFPQDKLDEFTDQINESAEDLQMQAEAMLDVIFDLANKSASFEDFSKQLAELYPEIDSEPLRKSVEKAIFTGQGWGQLNAEE